MFLLWSLQAVLSSFILQHQSPTTVAVPFLSDSCCSAIWSNLIPHSVGSSHSSSSMACCKEPGFCPSTVQPTAKQVPKISLAVPLNSLAKLFFLICRQMSKKTLAEAIRKGLWGNSDMQEQTPLLNKLGWIILNFYKCVWYPCFRCHRFMVRK